MRGGLLIALAAAVANAGFSADFSQDLLLARVLSRMSDNLKRLPNYTCTQTIHRSRRASAGLRLEPVDKVRVEVALVSGKELFAWPGAGKFEDKELRDMAIGGATSTGNFALLAKSVFVSGTPNFTYVGERALDGRRTYRWDYRVPQFRSGYMLRYGEREAVVGYHGSFWADTSSFDVVRLETTADDIPPTLEIVAASVATDYRRFKVGEEEFLLPVLSELHITDFGGENVNRTEFNGCHQYHGESVLILDADQPGELVSRQAPETTVLPPEVSIRLKINRDLHEDAAVGDPVTAIVNSPVKLQGRVLVPKGAEARGRIVWMRRTAGFQSNHIIGLEFSEIRWQNVSARMKARLTDILAAPGMASMLPIQSSKSVLGIARRVQVEDPGLPGRIFVPSGPVLVHAGLELVWRTQPVNPEDTQSDSVRTRN